MLLKTDEQRWTISNFTSKVIELFIISVFEESCVIYIVEGLLRNYVRSWKGEGRGEEQPLFFLRGGGAGG